MNFDTVIVANGEFPTNEIPKDILINSSNIICCDGAADKLLQFGLTPDVIIGDLDSVTPKTKEQFKDRIVHVSSQDNNDLTKAFNYAVENSSRNIAIVGATGARPDHTIANVFLLAQFCKQADVVLFSDDGMFSATKKTKTFRSFVGQQISLFATSQDAHITTAQLKYPITNQSLPQLWMGTLNESIDEQFEIAFDLGEIIVFQTYI